MSDTEKYISHIDDIDINKIKSIFNNMEDTRSNISINFILVKIK